MFHLDDKVPRGPSRGIVEAVAVLPKGLRSEGLPARPRPQLSDTALASTVF